MMDTREFDGRYYRREEAESDRLANAALHAETRRVLFEEHAGGQGIAPRAIAADERSQANAHRLENGLGGAADVGAGRTPWGAVARAWQASSAAKVAITLAFALASIVVISALWPGGYGIPEGFVVRYVHVRIDLVEAEAEAARAAASRPAVSITVDEATVLPSEGAPNAD